MGKQKRTREEGKSDGLIATTRQSTGWEPQVAANLCLDDTENCNLEHVLHPECAPGQMIFQFLDGQDLVLVDIQEMRQCSTCDIL